MVTHGTCVHVICTVWDSCMCVYVILLPLSSYLTPTLLTCPPLSLSLLCFTFHSLCLTSWLIFWRVILIWVSWCRNLVQVERENCADIIRYIHMYIQVLHCISSIQHVYTCTYTYIQVLVKWAFDVCLKIKKQWVWYLIQYMYHACTVYTCKCTVYTCKCSVLCICMHVNNRFHILCVNLYEHAYVHMYDCSVWTHMHMYD